MLFSISNLILALLLKALSYQSNLHNYVKNIFSFAYIFKAVPIGHLREGMSNVPIKLKLQHPPPGKPPGI